jgi:hypothetical protein
MSVILLVKFLRIRDVANYRWDLFYLSLLLLFSGAVCVLYFVSQFWYVLKS